MKRDDVNNYLDFYRAERVRVRGIWTQGGEANVFLGDQEPWEAPHCKFSLVSPILKFIA